MSVYIGPSPKEGGRKEKGYTSEKKVQTTPPALNASATDPCPTFNQINRTALNYIRSHNGNVSAYRFKSSKKGWSRRLMQRLRENVLHLPSPALLRR